MLQCSFVMCASLAQSLPTKDEKFDDEDEDGDEGEEEEEDEDASVRDDNVGHVE